MTPVPVIIYVDDYGVLRWFHAKKQQQELLGAFHQRRNPKLYSTKQCSQKRVRHPKQLFD